VAIGSTEPGTAKLYIDGNVGIGTTNPGTYALNVSGDVSATNAVLSGDLTVQGGNIAVGSTLDANIGINDTTNNSTAQYRFSGDNSAVFDIYGSADADTDLSFLSSRAGRAVTIDLDGQLEVNGTGNSWFAGNVGIGTTDPGGPLEVFGLSTATETLRPNAAGDEESIVYATSGAGNHWQDVNEETADDDTSYVYMAGDSIDAYYRDLYDLPASTGSGTINFIKIYIRARYTNTQGYAKPSLKSGSTTTDGDEITLTNSYVTYSQQWNTNPADGQAWEWTDIDTLQIGVSLRQPTGPSRHTRCTQVYVEVNYNVAKSALVIKASGNVGIN